ncbi:MAG TPA: cytochrome P450 [Acidimicrobiales bacterium]|nr:cytochrome P450 [Acidimicrobiales bacterium]
MAQPEEKPAEASAAYFDNEEELQKLFDLADPQPMYKGMLEAGGVVKPTDGFVIAASRALADEVLRHPEAYTSKDLVMLGNTRPMIPLSVDPPDHLKYRKILDPLFAPKKMDAIEDDIAARVNHFIDAFADRDGCNFTEELAVPFPSSVFLGLMGLPWEELDTFLRLKDGILRPGGGIFDPTERDRIQRETALEIYDYFNAILDERAKHPEDDILTSFLQVEMDGVKLTREEILDICFLFLIAGLDTVTDSLTCFFAYLAQHPDHRRQIVEDPAVIPRAVEELLRWETPVPGVPRLATGDGELAGCPFSAGTMVMVSLGAANVDPAEFDDPFEVRFEREENRHLGFGGGVHRCLGSHLARRELRVTLREWHRRIPDYELKPGIELRYTAGLRTVENLELVW